MLFTTFTTFFFTLLALMMPMTSVNARAIPYKYSVAKRSPSPQEINTIPAEAPVRGDRGVLEVLPEKRSEDLGKRQQVNTVDLIAPSMSQGGRIVPFVNNGKRDVSRRSRLFGGLKEPKQLAEARQVNTLGDSDPTMSKNEEIIPFSNNGKRDALPEGHERRDFDGAIVNINKFSTNRAVRSVNGVFEYI